MLLDMTYFFKNAHDHTVHTVIITRTYDTGDVIRTHDSPAIVSKITSKDKKHNRSKKKKQHVTLVFVMNYQ